MFRRDCGREMNARGLAEPLQVSSIEFRGSSKRQAVVLFKSEAISKPRDLIGISWTAFGKPRKVKRFSSTLFEMIDQVVSRPAERGALSISPPDDAPQRTSRVIRARTASWRMGAVSGPTLFCSPYCPFSRYARGRSVSNWVLGMT